MKFIIGIDLDNTIALYHEVFYSLALKQELIPKEIARNKKTIRDYVRSLPEGETKWQILQAQAYGQKSAWPLVAEGVQEFFRRCSEKRIVLYVISHKTKYAHFDPTRTNLREVALCWLKRHNFFDPSSVGLKEQNVFFTSSRKEKIDRIIKLDCTHFIDDLEETFLEKYFPQKVEKWLYCPFDSSEAVSGVKPFSSWREITAELLNGRF